jgi:hypothetical protein
MLYEMRTYTTLVGGVGVLLEANEKIGRPIRGDNYGVLEGYWSTEIGGLNKVVHLWRYDSIEERERLRAELGRHPDWTGKYVPAIRPQLVKQEIRFLNAIREPKRPAKAGNLYEFRVYRLQPGKAGEWLAAVKEMLPAREKYSECVFMWGQQAPDPNEVCHLWAYPSFEARLEARKAAAADPAFQKFAAFARPFTQEQASTLLLPASFSPLK